MAPTNDAELVRLRLFWGALLLTLAAYTLVAMLLEDRAGVGVDPELTRWLIVFLGIFSGCELLTALLLQQMVAVLSRDSYAVFCAIRWILVHSIGSFGLLLFLLGAGWGALMAFLLPSFMVLLSLAPSADRRQAFRRILQ